MGRHAAMRLRTRELRGAYNRLLSTYARLLREHRSLQAEYRDLRARTAEQSGQDVAPAPRQTAWGRSREAMDVEDARELVRTAGLLTAAGG